MHASKIVFFTTLVFSCFWVAQVVGQQPKIATQEEITRDVQLAPCKSAERWVAVRDLFKKMGATDSEVVSLERKGANNLVVTKKGTTGETVVVGAHYDKVDDGCGAIDNWTGIVAMAHLYGTLRDLKMTKTFKFIAFDKEEIGLVGSGIFVSDIPKSERSSYCSMVNLDSFGFSSPQILENVSNPRMTSAAKSLWAEMNIKLSTASLAGIADADSSSFLNAGIPAITFHGLNDRWPQFLHSSKDQVKNVNPESVFMAYRTILPFLARIDEMSCDAFRKK